MKKHEKQIMNPNKTVGKNFSSKIYEIYDFNNSQFKNHIIKKLYNKEGGQIINFIRNANDELKENKNKIDVSEENHTLKRNDKLDMKTESIGNEEISLTNENSLKTKSYSFKRKTLKDEFGIKNKTQNLCINTSKNINFNSKLFEINHNSSTSNYNLSQTDRMKVNIKKIDLNKISSKNNTQEQDRNFKMNENKLNSEGKIDQKDLKVINTSVFSYFPESYLNRSKLVLKSSKDFVHEKKDLSIKSSQLIKEEHDNPQESIEKHCLYKKQNSRVLLNNNSKKYLENRNNFFLSQVLSSENRQYSLEQKKTTNAQALNLSPYKTNNFKGFDYSILKKISQSKKFDDTNKLFYSTTKDGFSSRKNESNYETLKNSKKEVKLEEKVVLNNNLEIKNLEINKKNNKKVMKKDFLSQLNKKSSFNLNSKPEDSKRKASFHSYSFNENEGNEKLIEKVLSKRNDIYYCPNCDHCNNLNDENLDKHFEMTEAKNIIKKCFDYIANNFETKQNYLDFLLQKNPKDKDTDILYDCIDVQDVRNPNGVAEDNNNNILISTYQSNKHNICNSNGNSKDKVNSYDNNHNKNHKTNNKKPSVQNEFKIGHLLKSFPHITYDRSVIKIVTHFLDALINDKASIDSIASAETLDKLKEILIAQGISYKEANGELDFDKELDMMFNKETKDKLKKLFKSKF